MSQWQGEIDWVRVPAAGVGAAYIRATIGVSGLDSHFVENAAAAGRTIPVSFYHLLRPERGGAAQARYFWETVGRYPRALPLAVDVEVDGGDLIPPQPQTPARIADVLLEFVQTLETLSGEKPAIYTGAWFWNPKVGSAHDSIFAQYPLWVAHYGATSPTLPRGWADWFLWQYTSGGSVDGIRERVDMNRLNESRHP